MSKEKLFIVAKIQKVKGSNRKNWGKQKVMLYDRKLQDREHKFLSDVISHRAMQGQQPYDFQLGDLVGCIPNGSLETPNGEIRFWLPTQIYQPVLNVTITNDREEIGNDSFRLSMDGDLLDSDLLASRAKPGEEWEAIPSRIIDNRVVWFPWRILDVVKADPVRTDDGEVQFLVRHISGYRDLMAPQLVKPEIEASVLKLEDGSEIIRERFSFPVHTWGDRPDPREGKEPIMLGYVEIDRKYEGGSVHESVDVNSHLGSFSMLQPDNDRVPVLDEEGPETVASPPIKTVDPK